MNVCTRFHCHHCCMNTSMVLSEEDIQRIEARGYEQSDFCVENDGWMQLRNTEGHCLFLKNNLCTIYSFRPQGCILYPLIFDNETQEVIYDIDCPHPQHFPMQSKQIRQVIKLVTTILNERAHR